MGGYYGDPGPGGAYRATPASSLGYASSAEGSEGNAARLARLRHPFPGATFANSAGGIGVQQDAMAHHVQAAVNQGDAAVLAQRQGRQRIGMQGPLLADNIGIQRPAAAGFQNIPVARVASPSTTNSTSASDPVGPMAARQAALTDPRAPGNRPDPGGEQTQSRAQVAAIMNDRANESRPRIGMRGPMLAANIGIQGSGTQGGSAPTNPWGYSRGAMESYNYGQQTGQGHSFARETMQDEKMKEAQIAQIEGEGADRATPRQKFLSNLVVANPKLSDAEAAQAARTAGFPDEQVGPPLAAQLASSAPKGGAARKPVGPAMASDEASARLGSTYPAVHATMTTDKDGNGIPDAGADASIHAFLAAHGDKANDPNDPTTRAFVSAMKAGYGGELEGQMGPLDAGSDFAQGLPWLTRGIMSLGGLGSPEDARRKGRLLADLHHDFKRSDVIVAHHGLASRSA